MKAYSTRETQRNNIVRSSTVEQPVSKSAALEPKSYHEISHPVGFGKIDIHTPPTSCIQLKLNISRPTDPSEEEADTIAEKLMCMDISGETSQFSDSERISCCAAYSS